MTRLPLPQGTLGRGGHRAVLRLQLADAAAVERARRSLEADNDGHMQAFAEGRMLRLEAWSSTPMGLLRTLEDALNCVRAAGLAD